MHHPFLLDRPQKIPYRQSSYLENRNVHCRNRLSRLPVLLPLNDRQQLCIESDAFRVL